MVGRRVLQLVALLSGVDDVLAGEHLAEDGRRLPSVTNPVLIWVMKERLPLDVADWPLAAESRADFVLEIVAGELVSETVTRAHAAGTLRDRRLGP